MSRIGRNDPCPCGSGKKYKKCCIQKETVLVGMEGAVRKRLVDELLKFHHKYYYDDLEIALIEFTNDPQLRSKMPQSARQMAEINFMEWVVFDWVPDNSGGKTVIELFIERKKGLSSRDREILQRMSNASLGLYEVLDVRQGEGMTLKDLLMDGIYEVKEKSGSMSMNKWDIIGARLIMMDSVYIINASIYGFTLELKEWILKEINKSYKRYKREQAETSMKDFLKRNGAMFNTFWAEQFETATMPDFRTMTGEKFVISKAMYGIDNRNAVIEALSVCDEFEPGNDNDNEFVWLGSIKKSADPILFGQIKVQDKTMILECNSKERLENGKKLIEKLLPDFAIHKADSFEDARKWIESSQGKPLKAHGHSEDIPMDVQQELYKEFMTKHYENTLDEKIPILGNKTPFGALKTKVGKKKVIEWLKFLENGEERKKQDDQPYIDLSWMWERLGIDRSEAEAR